MQTNTNTRTKVTNEQINMAIEQLNSEGIKPTIRGVRERLGGGSPNRIQALLAAWHDKSRPGEAAAAVLGEGLQQALGELFARERSAAIATKLEEIDDLKEQVSELASEGARLENESVELQEHNETLTAAQAQAQAVAGQQVQRIEQLEVEQTRLQNHGQDLTQKLATAQAQLVMQRQQNQQQQLRIDQLATDFDAARQQTNAATQAAAVSEAKLAAAVAAMDAAAATAAAAAAAAAQRIERLEQQLEAAQKRADDAQLQRNTDAQQHIKQVTQRDEQLHVEHKKNAELMTKLDELSDKLKAAEAAAK